MLLPLMAGGPYLYVCQVQIYVAFLGKTHKPTSSPVGRVKAASLPYFGVHSPVILCHPRNLTSIPLVTNEAK